MEQTKFFLYRSSPVLQRLFSLLLSFRATGVAGIFRFGFLSNKACYVISSVLLIVIFEKSTNTCRPLANEDSIWEKFSTRNLLGL